MWYTYLINMKITDLLRGWDSCNDGQSSHIVRKAKQPRNKAFSNTISIVGSFFFLTSQASLSAPCCCKQHSWWNQGWAVTVYSGPLGTQNTSKLFSDFDFESGLVALAVAKKLGSIWQNNLDFEFEAQAVQHFHKQSHFELNPAVLVARWKSFPWNKTLSTTMAIGDGLSIAMKKPRLELKRRGRKECSRVLNYVMAEVTFSLPTLPQWALVARYHHRSGMFGTFHGVHDASTAFAAGVKYWF